MQSETLLEPAKLLVVLVIGLGLAAMLTTRLSRAERRIAFLSVVAHCAAAVAQELVYRLVYGGGDMLVYQTYGDILATYIGHDPATNLPEVLTLLTQGDIDLPFYVMGQGSATGSMSAVAGLFSYFISNELFVIGSVVGVASAMGLLLTYHAVRPVVPEGVRVRAMIALLLLPSVVFWTSALLKEAMSMLPVGLVTYGLWILIERKRRVLGIALVIFGAWGITLFKSYLLAGFVVAMPAYFITYRARARGRDLNLGIGRLVLIGVFGVLFLVGYGQVFQQYDVSELGTQLAMEQSATLRSAGGSTYSLADPQATTLGGQLVYAPIGILTVFFRPLIFEAHNAQAAVNALEATVLLVLFVRMFRRSGFARIIRHVTQNPILMLIVVYVSVIAVGVGLATTNLGTLSRYRAPLYAHFALFLVLGSSLPIRAKNKESDKRVVDGSIPLDAFRERKV